MTTDLASVDLREKLRGTEGLAPARDRCSSRGNVGGLLPTCYPQEHSRLLTRPQLWSPREQDLPLDGAGSPVERALSHVTRDSLSSLGCIESQDLLRERGECE